MVVLSSAFASLLLAPFVFATPVPSSEGFRLPTIREGFLCNAPLLSQVLCPRASTLTANIATSLGAISGVSDGGAYRYAVRYATAKRWQPPTVATSLKLPNGFTDPSALPLACPQAGLDPSSYSEDCLNMLVYIPKTVTAASKVPIMVWFHGGSFIMGSASAQGIDGAKLAVATNSIIVVVQYRLGAFGFLSPNGNTNLATKDAVAALQFINTVAPFVGGNKAKITIAGQSSGGTLVRALLAAPSASSLFAQAVMESDPINYGFFTPGMQQSLNNAFIAANCQSNQASCWDAMSTDAVLYAGLLIIGKAASIVPAAAGGEPIRPVKDGSFITTSFTSSSQFRQSKPILISTVRDEAVTTFYSGNPTTPLSLDAYEAIVDNQFDANRANLLLDSPNYAVASTASGPTDARPQLAVLGTDAIWRCPSWTFARNWVAGGGKAFVGVYLTGATYPGNEYITRCTESGVVCHQDDIEIVFGTAENPTSAQAALIKEVQARYASFLSSGNPNAAGYATWAPATSSVVHALNLGGSGEAAVGACSPNYWGSAVQYDYQYYNL